MAPKAKSSRQLLSSSAAIKRNNITERNATESALLALPPEIRNKIYYYLFDFQTIHIFMGSMLDRPRGEVKWSVAHSVCQLPRHESEEAASSCLPEERFNYRKYHVDRGCKFPAYPDPVEGEKLCLRMLQTCRQIHREAAMLPFALNTFTFNTDVSLGNFLTRLTLTQRQAVRSITLTCASLQFGLLRPGELEKMEGLQEMTVYGRYIAPEDQAQYPPKITVVSDNST